jgi:polar amino acid transport system permease protein
MPMDAHTIDGHRSDDDVIAIRLRHPGRRIAAIAILTLLLAVGISLGTNHNVDHARVSQFLFDRRILNGVGITLAITMSSMVIATVMATALAVMRLSSNSLLRTVSWGYIWFFRGTPLLVQIVFWGYLGLLYSRLGLGIPFTSVTFFSANTNTLIPALVGGLIALSLNEAAYASEIVRAGLLSIDHGQREAAFSLGMSPGYTMRRIVLPQAMKVIIPPMGNETISMLKSTSLLVVVAVPELYTAASQISAQNLAQIELLVVASIWYLTMTTVLSIPQYYLERYYGRGTHRELPPTPWQQIRILIARAAAAISRWRLLSKSRQGEA